MLFNKKRGQSANGSAILVAIVAAMIIMYILFLPPEEREVLLNDGSSSGSSGGYSGGSGNQILPKSIMLLDEVIGQVSVAKTNSVEHTIPTVRILTQIQAAEIKKIDSLYVKRGAFEETKKEIKFKLEPVLSSNLLLSFNVKQSEGRLRILLNNEEIFNSQITSETPDPIRLDRDYLTTDNVLVFQVSSPGAAFWRTNQYELSDIVISADITDISKSYSEQHFSITKNEFDNLEKAELKFTPNCNPQLQETANTPLVVMLNTKVVFGGIPICRAQNKVEIAKSLLNIDDNVISFSLNYGSFEVNNIKLTTTLLKPVNPTLYFDIPPEYYAYVYQRELDGFVLMTFPEEGKLKEGYITLNGHKANFKTQGLQYNVRVSSYLKDGPNALVITPVSDSLEIAELKVELR